MTGDPATKFNYLDKAVPAVQNGIKKITIVRAIKEKGLFTLEEVKKLSGHERVVLVGHSMGANAVLELLAAPAGAASTRGPGPAGATAAVGRRADQSSRAPT